MLVVAVSQAGAYPHWSLFSGILAA